MPHSAVSDLGLHCLSVTLLGVSQQQCTFMTKLADDKQELLLLFSPKQNAVHEKKWENILKCLKLVIQHLRS